MASPVIGQALNAGLAFEPFKDGRNHIGHWGRRIRELNRVVQVSAVQLAPAIAHRVPNIENAIEIKDPMEQSAKVLCRVSRRIDAITTFPTDKLMNRLRSLTLFEWESATGLYRRVICLVFNVFASRRIALLPKPM